MGKIFLNQDVLKIEIPYDFLPGAVSRAWIKYRNPDRVTGTFPLEAVHNVTGKSYFYIFDKGETFQKYGGVGMWRLWLYVELVDGRQIAGEPFEVRIYKEGQ